MSYIQLQLGGELRGLKMNMAAVDAYWEKVNLMHSTISSKYAAIYGGLVGNMIAKGSDEILIYEEVQEWVDELVQTKEGNEQANKVYQMLIGDGYYQVKFDEFKENVRLLQEKIVSEQEEEKKSLIQA